MPYLKLIELTSQRATETREDVVRLGREAGSAIAFAETDARVVSARHAELRHTRDGWCLADLGSRNGTFLNGRRIAAEVPVTTGDVISLGETGPRLRVAALAEPLPETVPERPAVEGRAYAVSLLDAGTGRRFEARGRRIRLGRGRECEVRPVEREDDPVVSRVHAELAVGRTGGLTLRDAGSRNGTFLNGDRLAEPIPVRLGDRITLGPGGPVLIVEGIGTSPAMPVAKRPALRGVGQQTVRALIGDALAKAKQERRWLRAGLVVLVLLAGGGVYAVYWLLSSQVAETEQARRTAEDSARAETERLRRELEAARAAAAPAAQVDSLRAQLESAQTRTTELRVALERAQTALNQQLAAGEARRAAAQAQLDRLRDELDAAERRAPSPATIDSLRHAVTAAEQQSASLDAKMRAIRGTDFASIAQQSQGAVGLITASFGKDYYNGTGFAVTPDGYMLTNWHVVADSAHPRADTLWVTMADQPLARFADVIATSQERDIAIIKVRGYQGPYLTAIDWNGSKARQGEPAALIGYPAGAGFARYRSAVVRTSMTAGIISRVTEDLIQFDGMTIGGSSGSPVFNANGEVISIHRAGLPQAPGFALSVPIKQVVSMMPPELRKRLSVP